MGPSYVFVRSPSLDTPYPTPLQSAGPSFLSAVGLAAYLKSSPCPCKSPDPESCQQREHRLSHNPAPVRPAGSLPTPVVPFVPPYSSSNVVPVQPPSGLHILTEDELNAAIDRMLERLDAQEGKNQGRVVLSPREATN